ncbi:SMP-30/gluconolactonase/LRE family protein [Ktedonosporobacter rubrisoli]|uniref:SMP-30/gluconolactonase/LRE family protein n=1 Tax=Ktedonosporobacter rubrisoli TaxID=2509675 RepID=A0A4P6JKV5_KTERU|nr:SMP-30/gluconolactonase/LRE family protein [Ktedonosporobacter rubrisoli]QBD75795.1 SMP-30/gluconolactonase/LRE family protein [Ktedonosporobacter rubrisoli]
MPNTSSMPEPKVLLDGLAYVETPRWHEGRLWFAHWGTGEIVAVDLAGNSEVTGHGPAGLGWAIDWLPDGCLLVTGKELLRREPDGSMVRHADLSEFADFWNEIVVDGRGNIYLNSIRFGFLAGQPPTAGIIALITPDGSARQVAGDLAFPNGMVVTPDNKTLIVSESFAGRLIAFDIEADGSLSNRRVWAEGLGPDGICMDAEGAIWVQTADVRAHSGREDAPEGAVVRIREGGEVLERLEYNRAIFAVMLGGADRKTLFMLAAEWRGFEKINEAIAARTGQVLISQVSVPGVGWP